MTQEKSPEDEAFEALERRQTATEKTLTSPSEIIKEVLRPFEEAVQEMSMDAMMYGTGMMKVSMNNQGQIQAETIRYRDAFPKDYDVKSLMRMQDRNETLEEVAAEFDKMPFGDTAASFAVFVRAMKR